MAKRKPETRPRGRRVALVTGGAKRVGRAIVERLSGDGFDVAFTYLGSEREAKALARRLPHAVAIRADLTNPVAAVEHIALEFGRSFDQLDVLVNSASLYAPARLAQTNVDLVRRLNAIHLESPLLLCQRFAPLLRAARGHVVK